jgi:hypothetical protein
MISFDSNSALLLVKAFIILIVVMDPPASLRYSSR